MKYTTRLGKMEKKDVGGSLVEVPADGHIHWSPDGDAYALPKGATLDHSLDGDPVAVMEHGTRLFMEYVDTD
jgi:hypothetical protein